jgi:predicted DNA-binding protein YlxM (UPF0122 family)
MVPSMTQKQFLAALKALDCSLNRAPELLGIGRTTVYRIMRGETEVPAYVEKLLDMYRRHGVPNE